MYSRLEYLQDICTLNHGPSDQSIDTFSTATKEQSSPSARGSKQIRNHLANHTDTMSDAKRARLPCTGIAGVGPHKGKGKHANRQCPYNACTECCRGQREATGSKCHTLW